jgi:HSP20 family protein
MKNLKFTPAVLRSRDQFLSSFDDVFNQMLNHFPEVSETFGVNFNKGNYPKVDVIDEKGSVRIIAEIPGYTKDDVEINFEDGLLTISGHSRNEKEESSKTYLYRELKRSSFSRSFGVDETVLNVDSIIAKFENGILDVEIPKIDVIKIEKKKIEIQ